GSITRASGYAKLTQGRYQILLDREGHLTVWDILRGTVIADHQIGPQPSMIRLGAMITDGRLLVLLNDKEDLSNAGTLRRPANSRSIIVQLADRIFAISLDDGDIDWKRDLKSRWHVTITHPAVTPIVVLVKPYSYFDQPRVSHRELDVQVLDIKSGETLHKREGKTVVGQNPQVQCDIRLLPFLDQVLVNIGLERLRYSFGVEEEAPSEESDAEAASKEE
ncbi:MAG: hypothetical protein AAGD07_12255, partial [Planctomycetota bacterium]